MEKGDFGKKWWITVFFLLFVSGNIGRAYAAEKCSILQIMVSGKEIIAYIECDDDINSVDAQVSQYPCESVEIISHEDISVHTIILLDNSLSVSKDNRENIKSILRQYVQELPETEVVSLALFSEDVQFLIEKSNNADDLLGLIDEIEFHDQETYLTDCLFQVLEHIEHDPEYTRFVVISDGVDNKAIGITKDELSSKLKETPRPIYTIGHIYKDNSSELKNMFALSRLTGGKELLIEDFEDVRLIGEEIHDFSDIYSVKMAVPQNVMDGDSRHVLLSIHTDGGDMELTGEVSMPFGIAEEPEPEPESESVSIEFVLVTEPEPEPTLELEELMFEPVQKQTDSIGVNKIVGVAALIIAAVLLIFYQKKNKKNSNNENSNKSKAKPKKDKLTIPGKSNERKDIAEDSPAEDEDSTMILGERYLLVLRDTSNPEKVFRYPMDSHVIVGRNVDMVQIAIDYSLTVSGRHCEFYLKNNRFFIRDMNSANHTYLEGRQINSETEIRSGNTVRLGEVEFSVEIMPI